MLPGYLFLALILHNNLMQYLHFLWQSQGLVMFYTFPWARGYWFFVIRKVLKRHAHFSCGTPGSDLLDGILYLLLVHHLALTILLYDWLWKIPVVIPQLRNSNSPLLELALIKLEILQLNSFIFLNKCSRAKPWLPDLMASFHHYWWKLTGKHQIRSNHVSFWNFVFDCRQGNNLGPLFLNLWPSSFAWRLALNAGFLHFQFICRV